MEFLHLYNASMIILLLPLIGLAFVAMKYTRSGRTRLLASILSFVAVFYMFVVPLEFTSFPKSVKFEWYSRQLEEATVLYGTVHPDTMEIYVLLYWADVNEPRYYRFNTPEQGEGEEERSERARLAEEFQEAQKEAEDARAQGGSGRMTMKYPFLSPEERARRMAESAAEGQEGEEGELQFPGSGYEQEDDSTFWVEPPPPPNPQKNGENGGRLNERDGEII